MPSQCVLAGLIARNAHLSECERVVEVHNRARHIDSRTVTPKVADLTVYTVLASGSLVLATSNRSREVLIVSKPAAHLLQVTS
jgi:hypothetical protein